MLGCVNYITMRSLKEKSQMEGSPVVRVLLVNHHAWLSPQQTPFPQGHDFRSLALVPLPCPAFSPTQMTHSWRCCGQERRRGWLYSSPALSLTPRSHLIILCLPPQGVSFDFWKPLVKVKLLARALFLMVVLGSGLAEISHNSQEL